MILGYIRNFIFIIINNNSTDNTEAICQKFINENSRVNIKLFFESNKGLSYARNRGVKESSTDIIVYLDDDALAEQLLGLGAKFLWNT